MENMWGLCLGSSKLEARVGDTIEIDYNYVFGWADVEDVLVTKSMAGRTLKLTGTMFGVGWQLEDEQCD